MFECPDYKSYLRSAFPVKGDGRGGRSRLAEHLGCKLGFISQVLSGNVDFSVEHGISIAEFLNLGTEEQTYFMLLLQRDRTGSAKLKDFYEEHIRKILTGRREVRSRIGKTKDLTAAEKNIYYSRWIYNALHMCVLIPQLRTTNRMAHYLGISVEEAGDALRELEKMQLIERDGGEYRSTTRRLHLGEKSLALRAHHTNWRMEAIRALDRRSTDQLHYSSVMSISGEAALKIRRLMLKMIQDSEPIIKDAKDEDVFILTMDLFGLKQS